VLRLTSTAALMDGRRVTPGLLAEVLPVAQTEISPIGDIRGSADYKRLLVRQLLAALIEGFLPGSLTREALP
jgi:xanthine dehydrogenase small subunit